MGKWLIEGQNSFAALVREESGQDLVEYSMVAALIALAAASGMGYVAREVNSTFMTAGNLLRNALS